MPQSRLFHSTLHCGYHCTKNAGLLSLALSSPVAAEAWSKPGLLDLPACQIFKPAGPIQYCELKQGRGDSPLAGDLVEVDYTARAVATGEVYDGSRNFKFTVGNGEVRPAAVIESHRTQSNSLLSKCGTGCKPVSVFV